MIDLAERAKRQEAYDHAKASALLEGLELPFAADEIMRQYVYDLITWEERQAGILALLR
jgi:hypothetical protein